MSKFSLKECHSFFGPIPGKNRLSILHIDDNEYLLELTRIFLTKINKTIDIDSISFPDIALQLLDTKSYDVIISDYQMPSMTGLQILEIIRNKGIETPFIILTGKGREDIVIQALNLGVDHYLQKGGDPESLFMELNHKIQRTVERKYSHTALELSLIALQESEKKFKTLVENSPNLIATINQNGTIQYINRVVPGFSLEDIVGTNAYSYLTRESRNKFKQAIKEVVKLRINKMIEIIIKPTQILQCHLVPLYLEESVFEIMVIGSDITTQINVEKALKDNIARYQKLLEVCHEGIICHKNGVVIDVNITFAKIFGYDVKDLIGNNVIDILALPKYHEEIRCKIASKYRGPYRIQARRKDGVVIPLEVEGKDVPYNNETLRVAIVRQTKF
ncbi:MAG: PAS domain S-box protein [Candidatus Hodarchaeales archaeon]|jgi:PAS domain S-box-containing protein